MARRSVLLVALFAVPACGQERPKIGVGTSPPARADRLKAAKMPAVTNPVSFDTPEADAILAALEVFPPDNPWNTVIEDWPLRPNSKKIVASVGADKPFRYNPDMSFVLVPADQRRCQVKTTAVAGEADPGPLPGPGKVPIEHQPGGVQRDPATQRPTL